MAWGEHAKAEFVAKRIELLAPGLRARGIGGQDDRPEPQLLRNEVQRRFRNRVARPQQATRIAEGAKLQGEAELIVFPSPVLDSCEVSSIQSPVTSEQRFVNGKREQALDLRVCQHAASRHSGFVPNGV